MTSAKSATITHGVTVCDRAPIDTVTTMAINTSWLPAVIIMAIAITMTMAMAMAMIMAITVGNHDMVITMIHHE